MDALNLSDELMRRCDRLRARSVRIRAEAAQTREKNRRLLDAAAAAQEAVMRAYGVEQEGAQGRESQQVNLPASR
jgi:hypothetical protein